VALGRQRLPLFDAWDFQYKTHLVWDKEEMGVGHYLRNQHEVLLFGVRGRCPFGLTDFRSVHREPRGEHSVKPLAIRDKIERASPGPYLELFGRQQVQGWTVWGNEIAVTEFREELLA
jgi:N6-adenosine-specific RNA methylase IME4